MPGDRPKDESRGKRCAICGRTKTDVGAPLHKVQGAGMGELWICDDCMKEYAKELGFAANEASPEPRRQLVVPPPKEIKAALDEYVVGQDQVKKVLSVPAGQTGPASWTYTIDVKANVGAPAAETMTRTYFCSEIPL